MHAVILRALARAPAQRFARPEDMAEALSRYLAQSGEPASSHALAGFIAQLHPPPTLLEREEPAEQPHAQTHTLPHLTLSPNAMKTPDSELPPEEDWDEVPGGPALSTNGQVVRSASESTPHPPRAALIAMPRFPGTEPGARGAARPSPPSSPPWAGTTHRSSSRPPPGHRSGRSSPRWSSAGHEPPRPKPRGSRNGLPGPKTPMCRSTCAAPGAGACAPC
ncbi:hypothetical protein ACN28S_42545 [Cystobacter fuscus]